MSFRRTHCFGVQDWWYGLVIKIGRIWIYVNSLRAIEAMKQKDMVWAVLGLVIKTGFEEEAPIVTALMGVYASEDKKGNPDFQKILWWKGILWPNFSEQGRIWRSSLLLMKVVRVKSWALGRLELRNRIRKGLWALDDESCWASLKSLGPTNQRKKGERKEVWARII
ncbi:hypothetical protein Droror1_Dr00022588 [Drosera rotundifolia]